MLLLAEGTCVCRSRLGNIATLGHFDALAFVKLIAPPNRPLANNNSNNNALA